MTSLETFEDEAGVRKHEDVPKETVGTGDNDAYPDSDEAQSRAEMTLE